MREAMVAQASNYLAQHPSVPPTSRETGKLVEDLKDKVGQFQAAEKAQLLPMGWSQHLFEGEDTIWVKLTKLVYTMTGWCITAFALSLGASFWFDTLNRFMVIRGTIKPQEKSQPEPSKD
jgi:hypothetical protein